MTAASSATTLPASLYRADPVQWDAERKAIVQQEAEELAAVQLAQVDAVSDAAE